MLKAALNVAKYALGGRTPITGPPKVSWIVTDRCNSQCRHCTMWTNRTDSSIFDHETEDRLIGELRALSVRHVAFSGGEMFLKPAMVDLIRRTRQAGLIVSGNSNGSLIDGPLARAATGAGLDMLTLSLDGSCPETHDGCRGVAGSFEAVMTAIGHLKAAGMRRVFVNMTIVPGNCRDIVATVGAARDAGADGCSIQVANDTAVFRPTRRALAFGEAEIEAVAEGTREARRRFPEMVFFPREYLEGMCTYLREPERLYRYRCVAGYFFLMIQPNGDVTHCPTSYRIIGNLRERSLPEIWWGALAERTRREVCAGKHPMCWLSCVSPQNVLLDRLRPTRLHRLADGPVLRHVARNLLGA